MKLPSAIPNPRSSNGAKRSGFALPMTIIAVAGLTLLLVGLMTVLTLERKTARSYSDAARADLAVESGLSVALASLTEIAKRDDSIVFRIEDPTAPTVADTNRPLGYREQFFTYGAIHENGNWRGLPLFSGAAEIPLGNRTIKADLLTPILTSYVADAPQIGRLSKHDQNIPRARWVDVPSTDPKGYNMRYAFWVEDLGGRIDGKLAGAVPRGTGQSTQEIPLFSFFGETPTGEENTLVSNRNSLRSAGSTRVVVGEEKAARIEPYIYYNFPPANPSNPAATEFIPRGFDYADEGLRKQDLNELVLNEDVDGIADLISRNIPTFNNRKGGFYAPHDYLKTIAANIIDYADEDTNATNGTDYRGIDSYPLVNQLYDRYERSGPPTVASNRVRIKVDTYVEFWNPTNRKLTGFLRFNNINKVVINMPFVGDTEFGDASYLVPSFSMEPNEFKVVLLGSKTYNYGPFPGSDLDVSFPRNTENNNYEVFWRDSTVSGGGLNLVDTARGILERQQSAMPPSSVRWKGNASVVLDTAQGQFGDPRLTFYNTAKNFANTYATNSAWGGRTNKGSSVRATARMVLPSAWLDGGSDTLAGARPGDDSVTPGTAALSNGTAYPARVATKNPSIISNAGRYDSIFELGNIFDPVQWRLINDTSAAPVADSGAGGGTTLAIGRPEYRAMDQDGQRAAQLLDLFRVEPLSSTGSALPDTTPININTAPREVLRSLFAGVTLDSDPWNLTVKPPTTATIGDIFADMVILHRNLSPLRSLSDLNNIRKQPLTARNYSSPQDGPFFGNRDHYPSNTPPASWSDVGREELFRKVAQLVQFQSKTFRIIVAGETRSPVSGEVISRSAREYHFTIEPTRDPITGLPIPNQPVRITKIYEKSL